MLARLSRVIAGFALTAAAIGTAHAQACDATFRVVGIAQNDVLNIREYPTTSSRILEMIPPDGHGIEYLCRRSGSWLFVQYGRAQGWASGNFLLPEVPRGRRID